MKNNFKISLLVLVALFIPAMTNNKVYANEVSPSLQEATSAVNTEASETPITTSPVLDAELQPNNTTEQSNTSQDNQTTSTPPTFTNEAVEVKKPIKKETSKTKQEIGNYVQAKKDSINLNSSALYYFTDEKLKITTKVKSAVLGSVKNDIARFITPEGLVVYSPVKFVKVSFKSADKFISKKEMTNYVNAKNYTSKTDYLLAANVDSFQMFIFIKSGTEWELKDTYKVGVGKRAPDTETIRGSFEIYKKSKAWYLADCTVYNTMSFKGGFAFHSVVYGTGSRANTIIDTRTEGYISHGCFRQPPDKAREAYKIIKVGTRVIVL